MVIDSSRTEAQRSATDKPRTLAGDLRRLAEIFRNSSTGEKISVAVALGAVAFAVISLSGEGPEDGSFPDRQVPAVVGITLEDEAKLRTGPYVPSDTDTNNLLGQVQLEKDQPGIYVPTEGGPRMVANDNGTWYGMTVDELVAALGPEEASKYEPDKDGIVWVVDDKAEPTYADQSDQSN